MQFSRILASSALGASLLLGIGAYAFAAPAPAAAPDAPQVKILAPNDPENKLHLTADQQRKMLTLELKLGSEMRALRDNTKMTDADKQKQGKAEIDDLQKQFISILSPDQRELQASIQAELNKYNDAKRGLEQQWMASNQKLQASMTPAQRQRVVAYQTAAVKQIQAINADKNTTPQQKQAKIQAVQVDYLNKSVSLLNPTQKATFQQMQHIREEEISLQKLVLDTRM